MLINDLRSDLWKGGYISFERIEKDNEGIKINGRNRLKGYRTLNLSWISTIVCLFKRGNPVAAGFNPKQPELTCQPAGIDSEYLEDSMRHSNKQRHLLI